MSIRDTNTNGVEIVAQQYLLMAVDINKLRDTCHILAKANNWWDKPRNVGECLCLIHSEISEAMEGYRKNAKDEHLPQRNSMEIELADALIRIFDLAGGLNLSLGEAFAEKLCYNQTRDDHKIANRMAPGGKKF
jgi:NTP pyrophosphatase (non-canonical NTP hydrolase)